MEGKDEVRKTESVDGNREMEGNDEALEMVRFLFIKLSSNFRSLNI